MRFPDAYDLKQFYNSFQGKVVRRLIRQKILNIWPDLKGLSLVGFGYAIPYLKPYQKQSERIAHMMPSQLGMQQWPVDGQNLVCVTQDASLPLETNSVDRMIIIHSLEYNDQPEETFDEIWRVLKSSGRVLVIVPNRMGFWARNDHTPLGQGQPYSLRQVEALLKSSLFVHEQTTHSLFMPPFKNNLFLRLADLFEKIGSFICPALGGVHIIEASKQIYAGTGKAMPAYRRKKVKLPNAKPVATSRKSSL